MGTRHWYGLGICFIQYQSCLIDSCAQQGWFKNLSHQHFKPMIKKITERFGVMLKRLWHLKLCIVIVCVCHEMESS